MRQNASVNPFLHTTNLQQTTFKTSKQKYGKISINESVIIAYRVDNMVAKGEIAHDEHQVFKSLLLQKLQKASICGKGLSIQNMKYAFKLNLPTALV